MIVGTILLTETDKYVDAGYNLPLRPAYDKDLLTGIVAGREVSVKGYNMLPPSIQAMCEIYKAGPITPVTIKELAEADLLIVSRSPEDFNNGKVFRLNNFICLVKDTKIEIWKNCRTCGCLKEA
jgi:hypothetical protein